MCRQHLKRGISIVILLAHSALNGQTNPQTMQNQSAPLQSPPSNQPHLQTPAGASGKASPLISTITPINLATTQSAPTHEAMQMPTPIPAVPTPITAPQMSTQEVTAVPGPQPTVESMPSASAPATTSTHAMPPSPTSVDSPNAASVIDAALQEATVGIDTMDVKGETKGNWLYKRYWWTQARKLHDEIMHRLKLVDAQRDAFAEQYTVMLNTVFADFYKKSGYEKGELDTALALLKAELQEQQNKQAALSDQEKTALAALAQEKENLDQLHITIQAIDKLAQSFDEAIKLLNQQVALCATYEQQAQEQLREIERELSDKQAKESYHQMRTSFENIINIEQYINGDFARYFTTLTNKTKENIAAVMASLAALKERGVDLTKQIESIRTKKCAREQAPEAAQEETDESSQGWLASIWQSLSNAVSGAYQWISSFWSSSAEQTSDEQETEAGETAAAPETVADTTATEQE